MDADSWSARVSSLPKRYQQGLQSRSDMFLGYEEFDGDDEIREEYPCPYCAEYSDIVGLCCHIDDEHPVEAKNGVCPVCANKVWTDMSSHITLQPGNIFKTQLKRKSYKGGSHSNLSLLRKKLREGNLQSLLGGSLSVTVEECALDAIAKLFPRYQEKVLSLCRMFLLWLILCFTCSSSFFSDFPIFSGKSIEISVPRFVSFSSFPPPPYPPRVTPHYPPRVAPQSRFANPHYPFFPIEDWRPNPPRAPTPTPTPVPAPAPASPPSVARSYSVPFVMCVLFYGIVGGVMRSWLELEIRGL